MRGHRRLDQRFVCLAEALATDMPFDGEGAWGVVEFFTDIFAGALELAATGALRVVRLVIDQRTRQLCRQSRRLRLLAYRLLGRGRSCTLKLRLDGGDIGIDHLVQQVELVDIELFSRQGKAVAPQDGDLMAQPLVECFQAVKSLVQARSVEAIV